MSYSPEQPAPSGPARMHEISPRMLSMVDRVVDYARRRLIFDVPLDKPLPLKEFRRLAPESITEEGIGSERALSLFEGVLAPACVSMDNPGYLAFIPSAPTKASVTFDMAVSASALYGGSWLDGAGAVYAENEVLAFLAREFGLPESAGGAFMQGGTIGNLSALVTARDAHRRKLTEAGVAHPARWVVVCSAETHSSVVSAAEVMDVDVVTVPVDAQGRLSGAAVEAALQEHGDAVVAVVATAGSTNLGVVDDLASIAALKDRYDFWLHVDGAYGLAAALAPSARDRFAGVERADSLIVDPHKWLFAPFDACALIYREPELARRAHTQKAGYLETLEGDEWNPSDYGIQLSRRARGLPLWFSLATYGAGAYREAIEHCITTAHAIADLVREHPHLELVREPDLSVVAFRRIGWELADYKRWCDQLLDDQIAFVTPSSHAGEPIMRFAVVNPRTTLELAQRILDTM